MQMHKISYSSLTMSIYIYLYRWKCGILKSDIFQYSTFTYWFGLGNQSTHWYVLPIRVVLPRSGTRGSQRGWINLLTLKEEEKKKKFKRRVKCVSYTTIIKYPFPLIENAFKCPNKVWILFHNTSLAWEDKIYIIQYYTTMVKNNHMKANKHQLNCLTLVTISLAFHCPCIQVWEHYRVGIHLLERIEAFSQSNANCLSNLNVASIK